VACSGGAPLVRDYLRFARRIAKRAAGINMPFDDKVQEAAIGIMRAERTYDPKKGKFESYAFQLGYYQILAAAEKVCRRPAEIPVDFNALDDPDDELSAALAVEDRDLARVSERDHIEQLLTAVPVTWRPVVALRFGLGDENPLSVAEVANRLGLSKQRVHQLLLVALDRLRRRKARERTEENERVQTEFEVAGGGPGPGERAEGPACGAQAGDRRVHTVRLVDADGVPGPRAADPDGAL
jgi:RNA polymerase sigma factor (sigma-70 family)